MPLHIVIPVGTGASVGTGVTTYSGLVSTVGLWLNRSDLGDKIPDFITLLEARLNRILRVPDMEDIVEVAVTSGAADLPTDYLEARHLYIDADYDNEIVPASLSTMRRDYPGAPTGRPLIYALADGQILFAPSPDTDYTAQLHYYNKIPALSADNETNWLIVTHPDVYLYGTLVMAEAFLWNDERLALWKSAWDESLGELQRHGTRKRHGGGPLFPRPVNAP